MLKIFSGDEGLNIALGLATTYLLTVMVVRLYVGDLHAVGRDEVP